MKKYLIILAFLCLPLTASAQQFIPFLSWSFATGTQATTTNLFSTTASSTNLYSTLGTFGTLITDIGHANGNWGVGKLIPTSGNLLIDSNGSGNAMTFSINGTEEARFSGSNGDLGIGLTAPLTILQVNDPFTSIGTNYPIVTFNNAVVGATMGGLYATTDNNTPPISAGLAFETYKQNVGLIEAGRFTSAGIFQPNNGFISGASSTNMGDFTTTGNGTFNGALTTGGNINGQTISSAANFTGSLTMNGAFANTSASNSYFTGNLGVGTTTPLCSVGSATCVDVAADQNHFPFFRLERYPGGGSKTVTNWEQFIGSGGDLSIANQNEATVPMTIQNGAPSNSLFINSNGNVGIGTSNPAGTLDVRTSTVSQAMTSVNTNTSGDNYGLDSQATGATSGTNYGVYARAINGVTGNYGVYSAAGTNYFGGNVGIGINNPANTLEISTTTALRSDMFSLNQSSGGRGLIAGIGASSAYFYINTGNSLDEIVGNNGKVGIGMVQGTQPGTTLEVGGTVRVASSAHTGITVDLVPSSSSGGTAEIFANNYSGVGNLQISAGGINPQLFLDKGGVDVAVGTTTPTVPFDEVGQAILGDAYSSGSSRAMVRVNPNNDYQADAGGNWGLAVGASAASGADESLITEASVELARSTGEVGIGTAPNSSYKLAISGAPIYLTTGDQTTSRVIINNSASGGQKFSLVAGVNNISEAGFSILDNTNNSSVLTITGGGSTDALGVSSTSPWKTFSVSGTVAFAGLNTAAVTDSALCLTANNEVVYNSGVSTCLVSGAQFKTNVQTLSPDQALAAILATPIHTYEYKNDPTKRQWQGLIAQELVKTMPDAVDYNASGTPQSYEPSVVDANLVGAIQAMQKEILALETPTVAVAHDAEDKWQDMFLALLVLWNLYLTFRKRK